MKRALLCVTLALLASGAHPRPALAQDTSDLQQILSQTVITTASKLAETGATAPATSTTVTSADLRRYGIHSLDEALEFLSLGTWTSTNLLSTDVGGRGVILPADQGSHFLLLVDGHAINEPLFGTARFGRGAGIPLEMVDHIEVILGPGSVLYGSNAMLGVVNVITKRARDWSGEHAVVDWEVGKSARVGAGTGWVLGESTELTFMAEYYRQYGPTLQIGTEATGNDNANRRPYGYHPNGPFDSIWGGTATATPRADAPSALLHLASGNFDVDVGAKSFKRSAPYNDTDLGGHSFSDDPAAFQIDRHLWIDAGHHATLSTVVDLTSRFYADTYDYQRTADTSSGTECLPFANCRLDAIGVSRWAGLEEQVSFDWLRDATLVTLVGVDGRVRHASSKTDTLDYDAFTRGATRNIRSSFGVIDYTDETLGAYAQQTWKPAPWLGVNAGARLDVDPRFAPQVSPRIAASVKPWAGGTLKAIYAQAFRAPSIGESLYRGPNHVSGDNLRPEVERSVEASLEQQIVGAHKILFGVFRSRWNDLIELHLLSNDEVAMAEQRGQLDLLHSSDVVEFRNLSTIDALGFNGGVEGVSSDGAVRYALAVTGASSTYSEGTLPSHPVPVAPNLFGNARVSYDLPGDLPTVALATYVLGPRPADRAFESGFQPPPAVPSMLDLRATLTGDVPRLRGLSYRGSVDWVTHSSAPYVVGPQQRADAISKTYVLAPVVDTFRVTVGLQWDFGQ